MKPPRRNGQITMTTVPIAMTEAPTGYDGDLLEEAEAAARDAEDRAKLARAAAISARRRALGAEEATSSGDAADAPLDVAGETLIRTRRFGLSRVVRPRRGTVVRALALLISLSAVATMCWMLWQHRLLAQQQHQADEYAAAAVEGVTALTSLDAAHATEDVQRILNDATGKFKTDFMKRSDDFAKVIKTTNTVTRGTVQATAVESMTPDSAVVLVAATSQVTGPANSAQTSRAWRLEVTVAREGGTLKMSKVEFVR